jgi:hypothetical protein
MSELPPDRTSEDEQEQRISLAEWAEQVEGITTEGKRTMTADSITAREVQIEGVRYEMADRETDEQEAEEASTLDKIRKLARNRNAWIGLTLIFLNQLAWIVIQGLL